MDKEDRELDSQSPVPGAVVNTSQMGFYSALRMLAAGKKITRLEWKDAKVYGLIDNGVVKLHKADNKLYKWIINAGDLEASDWMVVQEGKK